MTALFDVQLMAAGALLLKWLDVELTLSRLELQLVLLPSIVIPYLRFSYRDRGSRPVRFRVPRPKSVLWVLASVAYVAVWSRLMVLAIHSYVDATRPDGRPPETASAAYGIGEPAP